MVGEAEVEVGQGPMTAAVEAVVDLSWVGVVAEGVCLSPSSGSDQLFRYICLTLLSMSFACEH